MHTKFDVRGGSRLLKSLTIYGRKIEGKYTVVLIALRRYMVGVDVWIHSLLMSAADGVKSEP